MIDSVTTVQPGDGTVSAPLYGLHQDILPLIALSGESIVPWMETGVWCYVLRRHYPPTYDTAR